MGKRGITPAPRLGLRQLREATVKGTPRAVSKAEFTKIQELLYELRIEQIMTRPVTAISPNASMVEAKGLMRFHRFSGLPVTDGGELVGIISVEDMIRWLEQGARQATVADWMTTKVHTLRHDEVAVQALTRFDRHKVGRLPVLNGEGRLVGIVTPGDIIGRVLRVLDARYREEEEHRSRGHITMEELVSDDTRLTLRYRVAPADFQTAGAAATRIKRILESISIEPRVVRRAAIAAYEAEMNLAIHANDGGLLLVELTPERLEIRATDTGPGIADLGQAMTPGFSTAPDWIRELGFGAGMGLNNIKMCSDDFSIESKVGEGTLVRISILVTGEQGG